MQAPIDRVSPLVKLQCMTLFYKPAGITRGGGWRCCAPATRP
jgi:hypothetical protein